MEEAPAQGKKRKVSRKTHLRELAIAKKAKKGAGSSSIPAAAEDADPDYVVGDGACLNEDEMDEAMEVDVEDVGMAAKREDAKQRQKLHRVRGLSSAARVMETWISTSSAAQEARLVTLAKEVAAGACATAMQTVLEELEVKQKAEAAAAERGHGILPGRSGAH